LRRITPLNSRRSVSFAAPLQTVFVAGDLEISEILWYTRMNENIPGRGCAVRQEENLRRRR
jgi:hypothetical protein